MAVAILIPTIIYYLLNIYLDLIIVSIILTWIPAASNIRFFRGISRIGNAYMGFFRGFLTIGFFDFTPIIGILIYEGLLRAYVYLLPVYDLISLIFNR